MRTPGAFLSAAAQRRVAVLDRVRTRLWPAPTVAVVTAILVGVGVPELDAVLDPHVPPALATYIFGGGSDAAREILSAVATSLITVTSLTFSLTLITLQLASSQYTPRLLRTFAADRFVQRTLALFLATFAYALTVLRTVRNQSSGGPEFVPKIAVTLSYLLAMASVVVLVLFLGHLVRQIRIEMMFGQICEEAKRTSRRMLDPLDEHGLDEPPTPPAGQAIIAAPSSGFLVEIDDGALLRAAIDADAIVWVDRPVGSSLIEGVPVAFCWAAEPGGLLDGETLESLRTSVRSALRTGTERTTTQDVGYGLRQLTDVVVRALSPGINDPTTAVHGLSSCAAVLCDLVGYRLGHKVFRDDANVSRVVLARPGLADLLDMVCTQVQLYGAKDSEVMRRLLTILREVAWSSSLPEYRPAIADHLASLERAVAKQDFDDVVKRQLDQLAEQVRAAMDRRWTLAIG